ncbi:ABC transporter substrate-binding protein [Acetivibrio clariflavus]|uniref:Carbohydrate ABC transporter substrate-binding protein, CUT1 family n=1 Tax=Acetivibrio clariflavus (strain DSM 19732 / NBRC 101661 / EBR45) TaxID=720554 RepID=G8LZK2_ACECE|nr:ABC transporter substrate-binding protein [Acetivibrio clariflavus]AEV67903.1 carbohydrate ABC transporter substrate-binding protein, CUT1 family [Acetivibrio clariflavus DSM 19732]
MLLKKKKLGRAVVAAILSSCLLLSGCGGKTNPQPNSGATNDPNNAGNNGSTSNLEPYEINAYFLAPQCKDLPLVQEELNKLLKEKINATIKLNYFWWDSYYEKQQLAVSSGEKIDIMFSPSWWGFNDYVAKQAWLPLDDLLQQYGQDIIANIHPSYLKAPVVNGKLYAIPTAKDMYGTGGFIFNKALVEKYNFDINSITKPEDIEPWLEIIKQKEPDVIPFLSTKGDQQAYLVQDWHVNVGDVNVPVGYRKTDGDVKIINLLETDISQRIFKLSRSWYLKGYINKDVATLQDGTPIKKAGKVFAWTEQLKPGKAEELTAQYGYELVQADAWKGIEYYTTTPDLTNSQLVIPRTSKDPARAMMFINLLFKDKEIKNLLSWGIEGKHYKKVSENQIDFADGVNADNSGYYGIAQWAMGGNQFLDYLWISESPDKWQKMDEFNKIAKPMKILGWTYDSSNVKSEIAALATVGQNEVQPLSQGLVDYDTYYPKVKQSLEKAGIQRVIDDCQKSVDEFIKSQNK